MKKREKIVAYFLSALLIVSIGVGAAFFVIPIVIILSDVGNPYHKWCSLGLVLAIICICLAVLATRRAHPVSRLGRAKKTVDKALAWSVLLLMVIGFLLSFLVVAAMIAVLLGIYSEWFVIVVMAVLVVLFVIVIEKGLDGSEQPD